MEKDMDRLRLVLRFLRNQGEWCLGWEARERTLVLLTLKSRIELVTTVFGSSSKGVL